MSSRGASSSSRLAAAPSASRTVRRVRSARSPRRRGSRRGAGQQCVQQQSRRRRASRLPGLSGIPAPDRPALTGRVLAGRSGSLRSDVSLARCLPLVGHQTVLERPASRIVPGAARGVPRSDGSSRIIDAAGLGRRWLGHRWLTAMHHAPLSTHFDAAIPIVRGPAPRGPLQGPWPARDGTEIVRPRRAGRLPHARTGNQVSASGEAVDHQQVVRAQSPDFSVRWMPAGPSR